MAEHFKKFFTCDRCGVTMDQPVQGGERGPTAYTMSAHQDVGVGGGYLFNWQHLCIDCNSYVGEQGHRMSKEAKKAKEARKQQLLGETD